MTKTVITMLLSFVLLAAFGPLLIKMVKSDKYEYEVGTKFCVDNHATPKFTAKVFARFKLNGQDAYVVAPDFEGVPMQFMAVIPTESIEYWMNNCEVVQ